MALYKYLAREYADAMLTRGELRLGTPEDYRAREDLDRVRRDSREGTRTITLQQQRGGTPAQLGTFERQVLAAAVPSALQNPNVFLDGNEYAQTEISHNCYMYCMSSELSATAAGDHDSCVEIVHPENVLNAISAHLEQLRGVGVRRQSRPVRYGSRTQDYPGDRSIPAVFLKDADPYAIECEVRAIWIPRRPIPLEPLVVTVPAVLEWLQPAVIPGRLTGT